MFAQHGNDVRRVQVGQGARGECGVEGVREGDLAVDGGVGAGGAGRRRGGGGGGEDGVGAGEGGVVGPGFGGVGKGAEEEVDEEGGGVKCVLIHADVDKVLVAGRVGFRDGGAVGVGAFREAPGRIIEGVEFGADVGG